MMNIVADTLSCIAYTQMSQYRYWPSEGLSLSIYKGCFGCGVREVCLFDSCTLLQMSQFWKECCHLVSDVLILERVSVLDPIA